MSAALDRANSIKNPKGARMSWYTCPKLSSSEALQAIPEPEAEGTTDAELEKAEPAKAKWKPSNIADMPTTRGVVSTPPV